MTDTGKLIYLNFYIYVAWYVIRKQYVKRCFSQLCNAWLQCAILYFVLFQEINNWQLIPDFGVLRFVFFLPISLFPLFLSLFYHAGTSYLYLHVCLFCLVSFKLIYLYVLYHFTALLLLCISLFSNDESDYSTV